MIAIVETEFRTLSAAEIDMVGGGVNWEEVGTGFLGLGATLLAVAAAPETAGASLVLLGAAAGGFGSGILVGDGLTKSN